MKLCSQYLGVFVVSAIRFVAYWIAPLRGWTKKTSQRYAAEALGLYLAGDLDRAETYYREAMVWERRDADLHSNLGQVQYEQSRPDEAEKEFRQALDYDYRNLRALKGLAVVLQERGDLLEAMHLYLKYLEVEPIDAVVCHNLGVVFYKLGEYEKAVEYYTRAEKAEPDDPLLGKNHALALLDLSRFEEARATLLRAQQVAPEDGDLDLFLGYALDSLGDTSGALESFGSCIKKDPANAEAHYQFAGLSTRLHHYQDTVQHAKAAGDLFRQAGNNERAGDAYWELGWGHYMLDDWPKSIEASTEALKLNPALSPVHFNLGLALLQLGRAIEARQQYKEGIDCLTQVSDLKEHGIDDLRDTLNKDPKLPGARELLAELEERYAILANEVTKAATPTA